MALRVDAVNEGGLAASLGLKVEDILLQLNENDLTSVDDLRDISGVLTGYSNGQRFSLHLDGSALGINIVAATDWDIENAQRQELELELEAERKAKLAQRQGAQLQIEVAGKGMVITTAQLIEGFPVQQTLGIVGGQCIFGVNVFYEMLSDVRDIVGGRSKKMQKILQEARETALDELRDSALKLAANAVIAVRIDHSEIGKNSMIMVVATGTAVRIKQSQN
jgi:uncharacterized protein YbjQ (UPF0145 family)